MHIKLNLCDDNIVVSVHQVTQGIGVVNCIYFNPQTEQFWILDYRIYDPDSDKKTKIDHVEDMILNVVNQKKLPFQTVLMDSWYATQRLMALIDIAGNREHRRWEQLEKCFRGL